MPASKIFNTAYKPSYAMNRENIAQHFNEEDEYGMSKSKSLERIIHSKQEINHRLIPTDILLDAKPNMIY